MNYSYTVRRTTRGKWQIVYDWLPSSRQYADTVNSLKDARRWIAARHPGSTTRVRGRDSVKTIRVERKTISTENR